jgi:hypothetical protein
MAERASKQAIGYRPGVIRDEPGTSGPSGQIVMLVHASGTTANHPNIRAAIDLAAAFGA